MARKKTSRAKNNRAVKKPVPQKNAYQSFWDRVTKEVDTNQSRLSMLLGALIVLLVGVLVFNYFNQAKPNLGPSQTTQTTESSTETKDVSPQELPGKYTVKEGDTLFLIAEKYYKDGSKFEILVQANNLVDPNLIEAGQTLTIPKLAEESPSPTPSSEPTSEPSSTNQPEDQTLQNSSSDPPVQTKFGPPIKETTYTVVPGDWLSKISARAYGDIFAYQKIAKANNIPNPDMIEPGMVLTIPRG